MATGIIDSVETDPGSGLKSGFIKGDETGDLFPFSAQTFDCGVDDPVTFDLQVLKDGGSIAENILCITEEVTNHPLHPIKTAINQDIIVGSNEKLAVREGGVVTGNVDVQGGNLRIAGGGVVTGNITVKNAGSLKVVGGQVNGNATLDTTELMKINGGGVVTGNITVKQGHKLVIDNGSINGGLDIQDAFKIVVKSDSKIGV